MPLAQPLPPAFPSSPALQPSGWPQTAPRAPPDHPRSHWPLRLLVLISPQSFLLGFCPALCPSGPPLCGCPSASVRHFLQFLFPPPSSADIRSEVSVGLSGHSAHRSVAWGSVLHRSVCLSRCLFILILLFSPPPYSQDDSRVLERQVSPAPPQTCPLPPATGCLASSPPRSCRHLPLASADLRPPASQGKGWGGPGSPPLLCPQPTYHPAACSSPPRMRSLVLPRPHSRPLMIYSPAPLHQLLSEGTRSCQTPAT